MKKYNVIWFDDEFKTLNNIREQALLNGIILTGFNNAQDGLEHLGTHLQDYDAGLVDGKFFKNSDQTHNQVDDKALFEVGNMLDKLNLPWFILSGQISFTKQTNRFADGFDKKVYDKLNETDVISLWNDLKTEADKKPETQIKHKYRNVFDVCTDKYVGEAASKYLIEILTSVENPSEKFNDEKYFNGLRKVIEYVFRASNKIGLLHDKCIPNGIVNLTWSSLFLAGKEIETKLTNSKISCSKVHFPLVLANNIKSILEITSAASHTEGDEKENGKVNFSEYKKQIRSNYLLYSLSFQVMDLLLWFKKYYDENHDYMKNQALWKETLPEAILGEWINGKIIRIAENGYGTFEPTNGNPTLSILPKKVLEYKLQDQQMIQVITKLDSTRTKTQIESIRIL